jgi:hypothetical protein
MPTPKYLEDLWDAELRNALRETEIGTSQRTLSTCGDVTTVLASGNARGEPGMVDRGWLRLWWGNRAVDGIAAFRFGDGFEFRIRIRFDDRSLFRFRFRVALCQTI